MAGFAPHVDGSLMLSRTKRSMFTINIYLNGDFEGGW
jgi:hypothetical protein